MLPATRDIQPDLEIFDVVEAGPPVNASEPVTDFA
jgi:hypothetical protein